MPTNDNDPFPALFENEAVNPACLLAAVFDSRGDLVDLRFKKANSELLRQFSNIGILRRVKRLSLFDLPFFENLLAVSASVLEAGEPSSFDFVLSDSSQRYNCQLRRFTKSELIVIVSPLPRSSRGNRKSQYDESPLHGFFDSGPMKFIIDPEGGRILEVNKPAMEFYGWTRNKLLSMTVSDLDAGLSGVVPDGILAIEKQGYAIIHAKHRNSHGEIKNVEVHASVGRWKGMHVHFSIVIERDNMGEDLGSPIDVLPAPKACKDALECFSPFIELYASKIPCLEELMIELLPFGMSMNYSKGQHFLEFGEISPKIGFIVKGLFRQYTITAEGDDCTLGLYKPGQILDTFAYAEFDKDCPLAFEARGDCEVFIIERKFLRPLINNDPRWWKLFYYNLSMRLIARNEREISLLTEDASARYQRFLVNDRDAFASLQNYHIASYLGITSETLSRIRTKDKGKSSEPLPE